MNTTAFRYGIEQSIGDTAVTYTLTAARWGVLAAEWYAGAFFSRNAMARYSLIGRWIGIAAIVVVALGMTARIYLQHWVDGEVAAALPPVADVVKPLPSCDQPENMGNSLEVSGLKTLTIRQLKASARGKVPGYGRMTKGQLVAALQGVAS